MNAYFGKQKKFNGVVLVAKGQDIIGTYEQGYADQSKHDPITQETQFVVPGISKLFTVLAMMKLSKAGRVRKEDLIKKYVPSLDNGKGVNVQHLMNHTSGLADFLEAKEIDCYSEQQPAQILRAMVEKKVRFEPGKKCMESTTDYLFLAHLIAVISGERYSEFVKREIIAPLKLSHTCFVGDNPEQLALPYHKGSQCECLHASVLEGWSDVVTTAQDLFQLRCLLDQEAILPYRMTQDMETPIGKNRYGDAYIVDELWKEKRIYLTGALESGYASYMAKYKNTNYTTILLSNAINKMDLQDVEEGLMEKIRNEKVSLFKKMTSS